MRVPDQRRHPSPDKSFTELFCSNAGIDFPNGSNPALCSRIYNAARDMPFQLIFTFTIAFVQDRNFIV